MAARSVPGKPHGIGLFVVEEDMEGFSRGRNLAKMGLKAQDTAELFFTDVAESPVVQHEGSALSGLPPAVEIGAGLRVFVAQLRLQRLLSQLGGNNYNCCSETRSPTRLPLF